MAAGGERFELAHRARLDSQREFSFHCTYYFSKARVGQVEGLSVCRPGEVCCALHGLGAEGGAALGRSVQWFSLG